MKKINETDALNDLILVQEQQYNTDLRLLKEQFHIAYESIKPINLIKDLVHDVTASPEIKNDLSSNIIGLITGFISKKLLIGKNSNSGFFKRIFGMTLQFAVANTVAKHTDDIKTIGSILLDKFFNRK
jgi:hypothetical protein